MNILMVMLVIAILVMLPIVLFFGLIGLALFLWCWRRIGPYLINFGRWTADWRNYVPCGCMSLVSLILLWVIVPVFLPLGPLRTLLLVVLVLVTLICGTFAFIVLTARLMRWLWGWYRRAFWGFVDSVWGLVWRTAPVGIKKTGPPGSTPTAKRTVKLSGTSPTAGPEEARLARSVPAPTKGSWLSVSWWWSVLLGKPPKPPKGKPRPVKVRTTEQSLGQSESIAATAKTVATTRVVETSTSPKADTKAPPKRSWLGALWALMLGKRSKSSKPKPGPARAKDSEQATRPSETAAAATAKTGATARAGEAATTPERAKKERPAKRGFFAGIWTSLVRGVTFVVGLVFLGVVWVVQKIREGIEWIRVRLNLD